MLLEWQLSDKVDVAREGQLMAVIGRPDATHLPPPVSPSNLNSVPVKPAAQADDLIASR